MIAAIFTIKSWTPQFQMHFRWRVVNARKNHPSYLISPGPTQGLARYILGTRNIMYTTKLAYIRHLHRNHPCHQVKNMPRWIVSGCKIAFLMSLLADFPWARSRISALQGEGCFFYTHYSLCKSCEALFFHFREKLCQKLKVMRLRMDRQGFNTFYYTIESFQKFRATALLPTLWAGRWNWYSSSPKCNICIFVNRYSAETNMKLQSTQRQNVCRRWIVSGAQISLSNT